MNAIENQAEEQFKKRLEELKAQEVTEADDRAEISAEQHVGNKTEKVIPTIIDDESTTEVIRKIEEDEEEEEPKTSKGFWAKVSKRIKDIIGETDEEEI